MKERLLLRLQSLTIGFSTSSFSEGVRLADKSIRMEGALGSRLSMTFQTCQIPKLRGQYFDMLLNMFYLESYLKDASLEPKLLNYLFALMFCCSFQNVCLKEEGVLAGTLFMTFQTCNIPKLWPIFRYVAQYIIYRNISDGKRRTNKDCWITFEKELFCCSFQNVFLNEDGVLAGKLSMPIQTLKIPKLRGQYFDMLLNMFDIESYPTDSVARAKVVELPLTLWSSCGCKRGLFW